MLVTLFQFTSHFADAVTITDINNNGILSPGTGPIFLDEVGCSGNETILSNCTHNGVGVHNCRRSEDAGVICPQGVVGFNMHAIMKQLLCSLFVFTVILMKSSVKFPHTCSCSLQQY